MGRDPKNEAGFESNVPWLGQVADGTSPNKATLFRAAWLLCMRLIDLSISALSGYLWLDGSGVRLSAGVEGLQVGVDVIFIGYSAVQKACEVLQEAWRRNESKTPA